MEPAQTNEVSVAQKLIKGSAGLLAIGLGIPLLAAAVCIVFVFGYALFHG